MDITDYLVEFSGQSLKYCVGLVDMVGSTKVSAHLNSKKLSVYYEIFLNSMAKIITSFGGVIVKNIGDSLLYYFPNSSKEENDFGIKTCLETSMSMIESHKTLHNKLLMEGLPPINYRISSDYGSVILMKTNHSMSYDMIGPPVNMCSKINRIASPNNAVIGGDLYRMAKNFTEYSFKETVGLSIGLKQTYPVYYLGRKIR